MRKTLLVAAVLVPALAAARPLSKPAAAPVIAPVRHALSIDQIRDEARALTLVQNVLGWYTRTVGERAIQAESYKGHEHLFSKPAIGVVSAALAAPALAPDARRALEFLHSYLAGEFLNQRNAHFDDELANAELGATAPLSWLPARVPYKQLEPMSASENDAQRRGEIESAKAAVWRDVLNPILARKETASQRLAKELGYASYVALSEEARSVALRPLILEGHRFLGATDAVYRALLAEVAASELHIDVKALRRSDLARLRKAPRFEKFLPKELMLPAFQFFLAGIGLDMKTAGGKQIVVDDAPHPLKEFRAACFNIRVPDDVRISVKPLGGIDDFATFFHEGGHALHFANTTTSVWEFQQLGSNAATESFAELFGHVWDDPLWLRRYRSFVQRHNAEHHGQVPTMTDAEIAALARVRVFNDLYFIRRYASAKLVYESVLHGGDPSLWSGAWDGPTDDLQQLYRALFERAYGFALTTEDALRFRTDVDDTFYAADYARAFGLANLMHEALRERYAAAGKPGDWYENKDVGALLRKLYADGQKPTPDELARAFGQPQLDFRPTEARSARLLGAK